MKHDVPTPSPAVVPTRRRLVWAAWIVAAGLAIQAVSLLWSHPTAFLLFLVPGAVAVAVGVLAFLWEIATHPVAPTDVSAS